MIPSQVSFYILSPQKTLLTFVCQLIDTVLTKSDERIMVLAALDLLPTLDERLWSFRDVAFIPHQIIHSSHEIISQKIPASVVLTDQLNVLTEFEGVIINLTDKAITDTKASRLLEVIDATDSHINSGRQKYRTYQHHLQTVMPTHPPTIQVFEIA